MTSNLDPISRFRRFPWLLRGLVLCMAWLLPALPGFAQEAAAEEAAAQGTVVEEVVQQGAAVEEIAADNAIDGEPSELVEVPSGIPLAIHGRVLSAEGQPLADVKVRLQSIPSIYEQQEHRWRGRSAPAVVEELTAADGGFKLIAPDVGFWRVHLSKVGYGSQILDLSPLTEDAHLVDATLPSAAGIELRVLAADRRPAQARVLLTEARREGALPLLRRAMGFGSNIWSPAPWVGETDEAGKVLLPLADGQGWSLDVVAPGHVAVEKNLGSGVSTLRLKGGKQRPLIAHLDDTPLAGVWILAEQGDLPIAQTDENGRATVTLPPGKHTLRLLGPHGEATVAVVENPRAPTADGETPPQIISLQAPRPSTGRVVTHVDRQPLADALVWTASTDGLMMARSDASGGYVLHLPKAPRVVVSAAAHGYSSTSVMQTEARRDGEAPTLLLEAAAGFWGRVVNGDGEPLAGVEGLVIPGSSKGGFDLKGRLDPHQARTTSDEKGRLSFAGLPTERSFTLKLERQGFAPKNYQIDPLAPFERREESSWTLLPGQHGIGQVVDIEDQPIAGVEVRFLPSGAGGGYRIFGTGSDQAPTFVTDGDGFFVAKDLAPGRYDLAATAAGFSRATARGVEVPEGAGELEFGILVLAPGIDLHGRVVDTAGQPIADAKIYSQPSDGRYGGFFGLVGTEEPETTTGPEGRFVIADGSLGDRLQIMAVKEGYVSEMERNVQLPSDEPVRIVLQPSSKILGRVVDADGVPLEGVVVDATPEEKGRRGRMIGRSRNTRPTGVDGRFEIVGVEPGKTMIHANKSGFKALQIGGFEVPADRPLEGVELQMVTGAEVFGTLTNADGDPVGGVVVMVLTSDRGFADGGYGQTDGDGKFRIAGLPLGSFTLAARGEGLQRASKNVTIEAGENEVDLQFSSSSTVSGRVVDDRGRPVQGAQVNIGPKGRWSFLAGQSIADTLADGSFTFDEVPAGTYQLSASKDGLGSRTLEDPVEVKEGPVGGLEIRLGGGARVTGSILGLSYEELNQVRVAAHGSHGEVTQPDFEGNYRVDHVAPGALTLEAHVSGSSRSVRRQVTVEEGELEIVVDLEFVDGYEIRGTVYRTGEPEADAPLSLFSTDGDYSANGTTGGDGTFLFEGVPEGSYRLQVGNWETTYRHSREVEIPGDEALRIDLELARLAGRVVDTDGNPLSGASISLRQEGRQGYGARSDSLGRFTFGEINTGAWEAKARLSGYGQETVTVELEIGEVVDDLEIRLEAVGGLVLNVGLEGGRPANVISVAFLQGGVRQAGGTFQGDDSGQFVVDVVPDGSWQMVLSSNGFAAVEMPVTTPRDEPLTLQLQREGLLDIEVPALTDAGVEATVEIFDGQGQPFRGVSWGIEGGSSPTLRNGRRRVRELTPGVWTVRVSAADGQSWQEQVTVVAGSPQTLVLE